MYTPFVIIDGYNLMHAAGLAKARYATGDLQRQRHRLLVRISSQMPANERLRCTVVFDAIEAPRGLPRQFRHGEITVMFAEPGHEADELIEELIAAHSAARQLIVVSSDRRLQKAAKHRRADTIDSEKFLDQLAARAISTARVSVDTVQPRSVPGSSQEEADYWLKEFGDVDVDSLKQADDVSSVGEVDPWQQSLNDLQRRLNSGKDLDDWLNGTSRKP